MLNLQFDLADPRTLEVLAYHYGVPREETRFPHGNQGVLLFGKVQQTPSYTWVSMLDGVPFHMEQLRVVTGTLETFHYKLEGARLGGRSELAWREDYAPLSASVQAGNGSSGYRLTIASPLLAPSLFAIELAEVLLQARTSLA